MESPSSSSSKSSSPFLCWVASIDSALLSDGESSSLNTAPSSSEEVWCWNNLFERLKPHEKDKVKLFIFHEDRKRALLSIMLQRAAVHQTFDVRNHSHYELKRTRENKPYAHIPGRDIGNWNFNVSHHGNYVGIVSHHHELVGVDIVDTGTRSQGIHSSHEFISMFEMQLTKREMNVIMAEETENARYDLFFLYWAMKEAFIKAIGQGLGFKLQTIDFTIVPSSSQGRKIVSGSAVMTMNGIVRHDWRFRYHALDDRHVLAVSWGPCHEAITSFKLAAWGHEKRMNSHRNGDPQVCDEELKDLIQVIDIKKLCEMVFKE